MIRVYLPERRDFSLLSIFDVRCSIFGVLCKDNQG